MKARQCNKVVEVLHEVRDGVVALLLAVLISWQLVALVLLVWGFKSRCLLVLAEHRAQDLRQQHCPMSVVDVLFVALQIMMSACVVLL